MEGIDGNERIHGRTTMPSSDLERQLDELKSSTQHAIQNSWQECERLFEVNAASENRIRDLEQKLENILKVSPQEGGNNRKGGRSKSLRWNKQGNKKTEQIEDDPTEAETELMVGWNDEESDSCSSLEDESVLGSSKSRQRNKRLQRLGQTPTPGKLSNDEIVSRTSSSTSSSSSDRRGMLRRVSSLRLTSIRERTALEETLMIQMAEMQVVHHKELEEYALKLQQREDAIKTLEKALALQAETVDMLRKELDTAHGLESPSKCDDHAHPKRGELMKRSVSSRNVRHSRLF